MRGLLYVVVLLLFVVRLDLWQWNDSRLLAGLPIGLTYQVLYCLAVVVTMALLVRFAWPRDLGLDEGESEAGEGEP